MSEETAIRIAEALESISGNLSVIAGMVIALAVIMFCMLAVKDMGGK